MRRESGSRRLWLVCLLALTAVGCAGMSAQQEASGDLVLIDRWSGDFPVAELDQLPEGQRQTRAGYIGDAPTFAATLADGGAEILAMETMSAMPIEDKVAMAMAVVPRAGIDYILSGDERVPVGR